MTFPNAKRGIKKLFVAEVLALINVIGYVVLTIVTAIAERLTDLEENVVLLIALLVLLAGTAVLSIVVIILNLIGLVQTAKDESFFKIVTYVAIFGLVASICSSVFSLLAGSENQALGNISQVVNEIINTVTIALIVMGLCNMAELLNNTKVFDRGQVLFRIIIMIALFSLFVKAIASFIPNTATAVIEIIFIVISGILTIVQYFAYLSFLREASKMLEN